MRGRNVAGDGDLLPVKFLAGRDGSSRFRASKLMCGADIGSEFLQHQFGMVPGKGRFGDGRLSLCVQPGKQDAGLHLCRCDRRIVMDPVKAAGG